MQHDSESLDDVERPRDILPSFEVRGHQPSRTTRVLSIFIHVAFMLAIVVALVGGEWLWAGLLVGMYVLYQKA